MDISLLSKRKDRYMKFKELPEGYYLILGITNSVYIKRLEDPEKHPRWVRELDAIKVVHDGRNYRKYGKLLDDLVVEFKSPEEIYKERKSRGAKLGHIKRCLLSNKPLKGNTLELALDLVDCTGDDEHSQTLRKIGDKLQAGQPLDEYENHLMVDVLLLHARLS